MFAPAMMKCFICLCTCIILLCSFNAPTKDKQLRECQTEMNISAANFTEDTKSYHQIATDKSYDIPNIKLSEETFTHFSLRLPVVLKVSKYTSTVKMLCATRTPLPEQKFNSLYPSINFVKSSCRYFIYTLAHILI